jgi:NADPH:quinone reductase-like Zn-dependent oxidoreductase
MKAIVRDRYGSPDVLQLGEVDKPALTDEGVLVRVHATSVNAYDWHMLRGKPYVARLDEGLRRPKTAILGVDVAGIAEQVGRDVTHIKPGDRVFGSRSGAFAEYVTGRTMVPMPDGLSFEQAAAVPTAGQTALQGLRDHGRIEAGQRVLIIGAGGGVGTFAVQIAKAFGADVTATTSATKVDLVRSIGADRVIDYRREDLTGSGTRFDLILDVGGVRSLSRLRRVMAPNATVVLVAPGPGQWVGPLARMGAARIASRVWRQPVRFFLAKPSRDDLLVLKGLIEAGKVTPVVDRAYPFTEVADAVRRVESGAAVGKVVITIA